MSYAKQQKAYRERAKKAATKINDQTFVMLRYDLINSSEFNQLSASAIKLLIDLMSQYNGKNNGDLSLAFEGIMRAKGWKSSATLTKARNELLKNEFIILTRQGGRNRIPSLYALTCFSIDDCCNKQGLSKIDISPTYRAPDQWKKSVNLK